MLFLTYQSYPADLAATVDQNLARFSNLTQDTFLSLQGWPLLSSERRPSSPSLLADPFRELGLFENRSTRQGRGYIITKCLLTFEKGGPGGYLGTSRSSEHIRSVARYPARASRHVRSHTKSGPSSVGCSCSHCQVGRGQVRHSQITQSPFSGTFDTPL